MEFLDPRIVQVSLTLGDFYRALWEAQWQALTGRTWYESRSR